MTKLRSHSPFFSQTLPRLLPLLPPLILAGAYPLSALALMSLSPSNENDLDRIQLSITFGTTSTSISLPSTATLSDLLDHLSDLFTIAPTHQKLISRGKRLDLLPRETRLDTLSLTKPLLLIGIHETERKSLEADADVRFRKKQAYLNHASAPRSKLRSTTIHDAAKEDTAQFRFHVIKPFPKEVECFDVREKMLNRLANDPAVRELMIRRKYIVGTLTELHPLLQPTLLGLNKNAGEEISLRILTDDLTGTRNYATVRKVLLHELAHNVFGPHDVKFNTLNSELNKEVKEYETAHGIVNSDASVWEPSGPDVERTSHRLDEPVTAIRVALENTAMDEYDARRERIRRAAERRLDQ